MHVMQQPSTDSSQYPPKSRAANDSPMCSRLFSWHGNTLACTLEALPQHGRPSAFSRWNRYPAAYDFHFILYMTLYVIHLKDLPPLCTVIQSNLFILLSVSVSISVYILNHPCIPTSQQETVILYFKALSYKLISSKY